MVRFRFENEDLDHPDNIFAAEFTHPEGNEASWDAWLTISIGSTATTVEEVFDPLKD